MSQYEEKDSKGKSWILWKQQFPSSCGPACIYMIFCMVGSQSKVGGEEFIRNLIHKYGVAFWDLAIPSGNGSKTSQLAQVLIDLGLKVDSNHLSPSDLNSLTLTASEIKPAILHVSWNAKGGHFVVCVGRSGNNITILDPYYGLREVPIKLFPKYNPVSQQSLNNQGNQEIFEGRFSGWYTRII